MAMDTYAAADDLPSIFHEIGILPTQYNDTRRKNLISEGERRLLFAVLEDAIRCYLRDGGETAFDNSPAFLEAAEWLSSDEESGPFAFVSVCEALSINAGRLRSGIQNHSGRLKRFTSAHRPRSSDFKTEASN